MADRTMAEDAINPAANTSAQTERNMSCGVCIATGDRVEITLGRKRRLGVVLGPSTCAVTQQSRLWRVKIDGVRQPVRYHESLLEVSDKPFPSRANNEHLRRLFKATR